MTRKRSNPHTKKQPTNNNLFKQKNMIYLAIIVIIIVASGAIIVLQSDKEPSTKPTSSDGTWQYAMDTSSSNVGSHQEYSTGYIPTLIIIDVDGRIVHKSAGVHTKEELNGYVQQAKEPSSSRTTAPDFTLTTFDGEQFQLSAKKGTPVILDLMAVRCPPCHQQMPELFDLKKELGDEVIILSIDVDGVYGSETASDVRDAFGEYIKD